MSNRESDDEKVEEQDPTGRFTKTNKIVHHVQRNFYQGFDSDEGAEVMWIEYTNLRPEHCKEVENKLKRLVEFKHPNILQAHSVFAAQNNTKLVLITEFVSPGNLKRFLARKIPLNVSVLRNWLSQVLRGLHYLHSQSPPFIHRTLKCEHIYIRANVGELKIGSLDLSLFMDGTHPVEFEATPGFMAPELGDGNYSEKADVYSFGMLALELLTGEYPYPDTISSYQIWKRQETGQKPPNLGQISDQAALQLIERCLDVNPDRRPTCAELLADPYFASALNEEKPDIPAVKKETDSVNPSSTLTPITQTTSVPPVTSSLQGTGQTSLGPLEKNIEVNPSPQLHHSTHRSDSHSHSHHRSTLKSQPSIKCYFERDGEIDCIRIFLNELKTMEDLRNQIMEDFDVELEIESRGSTDLLGNQSEGEIKTVSSLPYFDKKNKGSTLGTGIFTSRLVLKYKDHEQEMILITKRTTLEEIREFATSLHATRKG